MNPSDQFIRVILIVFIVIHLAVWVTGLVLNKPAFLITMLNIAAGLLILIYWIQKQIRIERHVVDLKEVLFLCFELLVIASAYYRIVSNKLRVAQYVFFGIHLSLLSALLIFMLTFKMNRLI